nr:transmembrane protein 143 [Ciona intestinalis]|eukprot:XP_002126607.1 transmembrane protein 143 [Ciona intestinalis]
MLSVCLKCLPGAKRSTYVCTKKVLKIFCTSNRTLFLSKKNNENPTTCEAIPDPIRMRRSQCIQELCNHYVNSPDYATKSEPGVKSWPHHFITASHVLETYLLLRHHKGAKTLMHRFANIDPDRSEVPEISSFTVQHEHSLEELSFMTQFAFTLKRAGYHEVHQDIIIECLKKQHKYGNIELSVNFEDYEFARFWIYGRNKILEQTSDSEYLWKAMFSDDNVKTRTVHERVVVAARNRNSKNMILKGFKDVPVDHFETLLPEAKVQIPRGRRWFINFSLTTTAMIAFFNVGMTVLTDLKLGLVWMLSCFIGFITYRSYAMYKSQRNKYILAWKKMLYYKSTSNNRGLVMDAINKGHERSLKEALIVYGIALKLTQTKTSVTQQEVTSAVRTWLASITGTQESSENLFSCSGAFSLLERLGVLCQTSNDVDGDVTAHFSVQTPDSATQQLLAKVTAIAAE